MIPVESPPIKLSNEEGWEDGKGDEGYEAPRHEEEEGRGSRGGADEGHAEEVSLSRAARTCRGAPRSAAERFVDSHVRGLKDQF